MGKYRKIYAMTAVMLAAASVFAGCKKKEEEPQPVTTEATTEQTTQAEPEVLRSPTSGKVVQTEAEINYPVLVSIPNDNSARPHYGVSQADVIYEMYVEGNITRLAALFGDTKPEKVGPIRSARVYTVDIAEDWMSALVHFGGPGSNKSYSFYTRANYSLLKYRLDGIKDSTYIKRDKSRTSPNNAFANLKTYSETITEPAPLKRPFKFSDKPTAGSKDAKEITIAYNSSNKVKYVYNADKGTYDRFINDKAYVDGANDTQVSVKNIIIQEAPHSDYSGEGDPKGRVKIDLLGKGKAYIYIGGKLSEGSWERKYKNSATVYRDENGNVVNLAEGQTFVQIVSSSVEITDN